MGQQTKVGGSPTANPVPYSPEESSTDTAPSSIQPPGVDQEEEIDLETALTTL